MHVKEFSLKSNNLKVKWILSNVTTKTHQKIVNVNFKHQKKTSKDFVNNKKKQPTVLKLTT